MYVGNDIGTHGKQKIVSMVLLSGFIKKGSISEYKREKEK